MNFNDLDAATLAAELPQFENVIYVAAGTQKRVFRCSYEGSTWILKVALVTDRVPDPGASVDEATLLSSATSRARREVAVLRTCNSPYLVQLGPLDLEPLKIGNLSLLYYLEEYVEGEDLMSVLRREKRLPPGAVSQLGIQMALAIDALWNCDKNHRIVHRDIKPANIMRRSCDDSFVLLDVGLAYDLLQESISSEGGLTGSVGYASPEQLRSGSKRDYDYRLDMFSLGVVMYKAATGVHPFIKGGESLSDILQSTLRDSPPSPHEVLGTIPCTLSDVIVRLLAKKPHLRYRTCEMLISALSAKQEGGAEA